MANGLLVRFFIQPKLMGFKSEKEGRPIYEDREYVSIIPYGSTKTNLVDEVNDTHRKRFKEEYSAFKNEGAQIMNSGTPLKEWPTITASQARELNYFNVYTVEQLADLDDGAVTRIGMGSRELRAKATAFVSVMTDFQATEKYAAENQRLTSEIDALKQQMADISANMLAKREEEMTGRPPKAATAG